MADEKTPAPTGSPSPPVTRRATATVTTAEFWQGPLPPPEDLARYNQAFPGAAERVVTMAEEQSAHRRAMERREQRNDFTLEFAGLILGAVLTGILLVGGLWLIAHGLVKEGFGALVTGVGAVIGSLLASRKKKEAASSPPTEKK